MDGVVDLAVCGAIVQVWGSQKWERMGIGRTACPECVRRTGVARAPAPAVDAAPVPAGGPARAPRRETLLRAVG